MTCEGNFHSRLCRLFCPNFRRHFLEHLLRHHLHLSNYLKEHSGSQSELFALPRAREEEFWQTDEAKTGSFRLEVLRWRLSCLFTRDCGDQG